MVLSLSSFKFSPAANFARSSELAAHVWVPNDTEFDHANDCYSQHHPVVIRLEPLLNNNVHSRILMQTLKHMLLLFNQLTAVTVLGVSGVPVL